jgi:DNA-binding NtrC family response regulator
VLDEIAHLSTDAQAKLLRVIERREFERLGGRKTIKLDARVIALTNVDLDAAVKNGRFREDLFYRLNVINIRLPPLRERKDDLSQLIEHFLRHYSAKHGRDVQRVSPEARAVLKAYDYPGNARELANIIERAVIVAGGKKVEAEDLPAGLSAAVNAQQRKTKPLSLAQLEAVYISETLAATGGNKAECARILGISRKNLYEKIARYKI